MAVTKYIVHTFNAELAAQGSLCAMVKTNVNDGAEVSTAEETGTTEPTLKGVGICRVNGDRYYISIKSATYSFNQCGISPSSNAVGYKLMLAETKDKASEVGNAVETDSTTAITRGANGSVSYEETEGDSSVIISGLEARDQFAIHALKTLMERMDKDPATVSDNEKMYICEEAYKWAANMMTQASKVRASIETEPSEDGTVPDGSVTRGVSVDTSEITNTTDKLLNNIVAALEKTEEKRVSIDGQTQTTVYSERVSIPKLIEWLDNYTKHTPTSEGDTQQTVGLEDLINAIKSISSGGGEGSSKVQIISIPNVNIGNEGLGRNKDNPIHVNDIRFSYTDKVEAEADGWTYFTASNVWRKEGYLNVPGDYTDAAASTLPTCRYGQRISILELPDLIKQLKRIADALENN